MINPFLDVKEVVLVVLNTSKYEELVVMRRNLESCAAYSGMEICLLAVL